MSQTTQHKDKYNRLFPSKVSTNNFLTLYILFILQNSTRMYGKEISDFIYKRFQGSWKPSHGMLYPILRELEEKGLVIGYWEDNDNQKRVRRFYEITDEGKNAFHDYVETVRPQIEESENIIRQIKHDFFVRNEVQHEPVAFQ